MNTDIVRADNALSRFEPTNYDQLERLAERCYKSKLYPGIQSADAALVIMLRGASLGIPPVAAMHGIHYFDGKTVLSSDLIVATVKKSPLCLIWKVVETTAERCVIETHRKGEPDPVRHEWTIADARTGNLLNKNNWKNNPRAMLRARCGAELGRMVYPDLLLGVYTAEEIDSHDGARDEGPVDAGPAHIERPQLNGAMGHSPATSPTMGALDTLKSALAETTDLASMGAAYRECGADFEGTSASMVHVVMRARAVQCGYSLTGAEIQGLCAGTLDPALVAAFDSLAQVGRHADDETGDGVIADVVGAMRPAAGLHQTLKSRVAKVALDTLESLKVDNAKVRLTAALNPPSTQS